MRSLLDRGPLDVLIPLGALEQHGPHLPLGTDAVIADAVAREVASRVDDLVVAPCLPVGCSDHHLSFAGTASVPRPVVVSYLRAVASTLLSHGFRCAYMWSAHAGNNPALVEAAASVSREEPGRAAAFADWPAQRRLLHAWADAELGMSPERVGSHAGHFETSVMLALAPESVRVEAVTEGFIGPAEEASGRMSERGIVAVSEIGVIGDARAATAEAGRGYLEVLVVSVVSFIEDHRGSAGTG